MAKHFFVAATALLCHLCLAVAIPGTANSFQAIAVSNPCTTAGSGDDVTVYDAKASDSLWDNGQACGKTYCVVCTDPACSINSSIYVMIRSNCPNCGATMSISQDGFEALAGSSSNFNINFSEKTPSRFPCA